jgi:predicted ATPase
MEALVLAGDRFSALRTFDEWKERLADELDAEPSSLLEGMAAQLRKRGWEPREPVAMPPVPAEQWRDQKFVGRRAEYRKLYETWEATHQFRPRHVHVVGDSGVGKSTLAQRLVTAAGLEGASVARVQCYHLEQRLPYAAIRGLIAGLLGRPGVAATAPPALAEIARIVPQVRDHFAVLPAPRPSEGETARLLFAEGVMDLFGAVMDERPLLLVLDDYHLSDEASLAVLHLILRRLDRGRYMVVVTTRPHDEAETPQARRIREGMARLRMDPLTLHPMSDDESSELLGVILEGLDRRPRPP